MNSASSSPCTASNRRFRRIESRTEIGDLVQQRLNVAAGRLRLSDRFRLRVPFVLQTLRVELQRFASRLERQELVDVETISASRQRDANGFGILSNGLRIEHLSVSRWARARVAARHTR